MSLQRGSNILLITSTLSALKGLAMIKMLLPPRPALGRASLQRGGSWRLWQCCGHRCGSVVVIAKKNRLKLISYCPPLSQTLKCVLRHKRVGSSVLGNCSEEGRESCCPSAFCQEKKSSAGFRGV